LRVPCTSNRSLSAKAAGIAKLGLFAQLYDLPSLGLPKPFDFAQKRVLRFNAHQIHASSCQLGIFVLTGQIGCEFRVEDPPPKLGFRIVLGVRSRSPSMIALLAS